MTNSLLGSAHAPPMPRHSLRRTIAAKASDLLPPLDFMTLLMAGHLSFLAYPVVSLSAAGSPGLDLQRLTWIAACIAPFLLYDRDFSAHANRHNSIGLGRGYLRRLVIFAAVTGIIGFSGRWLDHAPPGWMIAWLAWTLLLTALSRMLLALGLQRWRRLGALREVIAVLGSGPIAKRLMERLHQNPLSFGVFDSPNPGDRVSARQLEASIQRLLCVHPAQRPDRIMIALPASGLSQLKSIIERLQPLGIPIELCAKGIDEALPAQRPVYVGDSLPMLLICDRPIRRWDATFKSAKDLVLASLIALALLPILASIALAIRLDSPGPILFKQRRHCLSNREFDIYKFRTMHHAAVDASAQLQQTVRGDTRVTRVGRFLRKWSLDELPQIFNVLEGSMSLVGPRPHAVNMKTENRLGHEIIDAYPHRHRVKPGITGWAQINGARGATDTADQLRRRIELDLYYVDNWSLLFDLKILTLTSKEVLRATNAY